MTQPEQCTATIQDQSGKTWRCRRRIEHPVVEPELNLTAGLYNSPKQSGPGYMHVSDPLDADLEGLGQPGHIFQICWTKGMAAPYAGDDSFDASWTV